MVKKIGLFLIIPLMLCLVATQAYCADEAVLGNKRWIVENDGDFIPGADSSYDIGASGSEVSDIFTDALTLGGVQITGVSGLSTPMEDLGVYTSPIDSSGAIKLYDNGDIVISGDLDVNGDGINCDGDLLITPAGVEVHIDGGLSIGDTTAIGDNNLNVVGTTTFNDAVGVVGTTPILTIGDGGNEDNTLLFDGQSSKDFYIATDNADDTFIIGYGTIVGIDARIRIDDDATQTTITLGDAVTAEDTLLVWDGNAVDFRIALDDSADELEIGYGTTVETDERLTIGGGLTETVITIGDGASTEDQILVFDGDANDYYIAYDSSSDDLIIGQGSTVDTTPAITIYDTTQLVEIETDLTVKGGEIVFTSGSASKPVLTFTSTVVASTSSSTVYDHTRGGVDAVDGDDIHTDIYSGYDDGTPTVETYVTVLYEMTDTAVGAEDGNVTWSIVSAGSDLNFFELDGIGGVEINSGAADIDFQIDGDSIADLFKIDAGTDTISMALNAADSQLLITQTDTTGTASAPLIYINDDRTGANANSAGEATLMIDPQGTHAINIVDGLVYCGGAVTLGGAVTDVITITGKVAGATPLSFDGNTVDTVYTILAITDPVGSSKTVTLPSITSTISLETAATTVITADTIATITVVPGTDVLFTYTIDTDNEDCTLTFSAGGTAGDIATIIFITDSGGSQDEIMTFDGTLSDTEGTLTLADGASKRYVISFISDGTIWNEISRTAVLG